MLRGSYLVGMLASTAPAWMRFDPLVILVAAEEDQGSTRKRNPAENADRDESLADIVSRPLPPAASSDQPPSVPV
jgi:hypothetical protein